MTRPIIERQPLLQEAVPYLIPEDWQETFVGIQQLAGAYNAQALNLQEYLYQPDITESIRRWGKQQELKKSIQERIAEEIRVSVERQSNASDRAQARYNIEYAPQAALSGGCNYSFWTPLMNAQIFRRMTSQSTLEMGAAKIVDVGAGSGDLEAWLLAQGISANQIIGVDISEASVRRLQSLGIKAAQGRIENLVGQLGSADMLFLSYFVDRDEDQRGTFSGALELLQSGGILVFEGLLPAELTDPGGVSYVDKGQNTITRGENALEDLSLLCESLVAIGASQGKTIQIQNLAAGQRFVWSRDGLENLASYFITAKVQ